MTYYSADEEYRNGANYISSLQPGESIQIAMAWIVNEEDLENMYLSFNSDGDAYEFSDSMLKAGLVYIGITETIIYFTNFFDFPLSKSILYPVC